MANRFILLAAHVLLLALASTGFTIATGILDGQFHWQYFRYTFQLSWGVPYQFPYSLPVVLCYIAAYAAGVFAYLGMYRSGSSWIGRAGIVLCAAGCASAA